MGGEKVKFAVWGNNNSTLTDVPYHKLTLGSASTAEYDYDSAVASVVFYIGETTDQSYVTFNGVRFADLEIKRSDFANGTLVMSLAVFDANRKINVGVRNLEEPVTPPEESQPYRYVDAEGVEIKDWIFDANGISKEIVYTEIDGARTAVLNYGLVASSYREGAEATDFVLTGGAYILLGKSFDVTQPVTLKFKTDVNGGAGRFLINGFASYESLFTAGQNAWMPDSGALFNLWGSNRATEPTDPYHKLTMGEYATEEFDYDANYATVMFFIGETADQSYVTFNGTKFADLNLKRSDFADGIMFMNLIRFDADLKISVCTYSVEDLTVTYRSNVPDFNMENTAVKKGEQLTAPSAPNYEGYEFIGYFDDEEGLIAHDFSKSVMQNLTVYALYKDVSKDYAAVTFQSMNGNFDPVQKQIEVGTAVADPGQLFVHNGFKIIGWTQNGQSYDFSEIVTEDITLTAVWEEPVLDLYHSLGGIVDKTWKYQYESDENGFDNEFTDWWNEDECFVDENGNVVLSRYGGTQHGDSFFIDDNGRTVFLTVGDWHITNLYKLDLTKEIRIEFSWDNWDEPNGNPIEESLAHFSAC